MERKRVVGGREERWVVGHGYDTEVFRGSGLQRKNVSVSTSQLKMDSKSEH